jgi:hypothetical protein
MNNLHLFLIFSFLCICNIHANCQYTNIKIGSGDDEPSIMMNPLNASIVVVGTNKATIYNSTDTGRNWNEQFMPNPNYFSGDPCIVVDTNNVFYHFSLGGVWNTVGWLEALVCYRSYDGGLTWADSTQIGRNDLKDQDKEWAVVDKRTNIIYMTWTEFDKYGSVNAIDSSRIMFSKSSDQAHTWTLPKQINLISGNCIDEDETTEGAVPTVGPNGEIYVAWADGSGIKFDRSFDEGNTWIQNDISVANQPNGWDYAIPGILRANGLPVTDCDRSKSIYKGRVYINWTDQLNGTTDTDVWISYSDDSGTTWTPRIRVNNDAPGKHQFFSWMTIDQFNGNVYVVFYDRRNYSNNKTDVYLAKSTDGGLTFVNELISTTAFTPSASVFFGDYTNITAVNNVVRPVWCRADGTSTAVWTALIDYNYPLNIKSVMLLEDILLFPNPTKGNVTVQFPENKIQENRNIKFYDIRGREVKNVNILNKSTSIEIDIHTFSEGIYFYKIWADNVLVKKGKLLRK